MSEVPLYSRKPNLSPHSGLQRVFLSDFDHLSVTLSIGTPLCPYGISSGLCPCGIPQAYVPTVFHEAYVPTVFPKTHVLTVFPKAKALQNITGMQSADAKSKWRGRWGGCDGKGLRV